MAELHSSDVLAQSQLRKREYTLTTQMCTYQHTINFIATPETATTISDTMHIITYYGIDNFQSVLLGINDSPISLNSEGIGKYTNLSDTTTNIKTINVKFFNDGKTIGFYLEAGDGEKLTSGQAKLRVVINYMIPIFNLKLNKVFAGCLKTNSENSESFSELLVGISRTNNILQFNNTFVFYPQNNKEGGSPYNNVQCYYGYGDSYDELGEDYEKTTQICSEVQKLVFYTIGD